MQISVELEVVLRMNITFSAIKTRNTPLEQELTEQQLQGFGKPLGETRLSILVTQKGSA